MGNKMCLKSSVHILAAWVALCSCTVRNIQNTTLDVDRNLAYCDSQVQKTLKEISGKNVMPRNILHNEAHWNLCPVEITEWTVGFWPGILWYNYENTGDMEDKDAAVYYTDLLLPSFSLLKNFLL